MLVREIGRTPAGADEGRRVRPGIHFDRADRRARARSEGVFRSDLDARLLAWIFYGAIEEILTGWVLGQLPDGDEDVERAERTVVDVVCEGMAVR